MPKKQSSVSRKHTGVSDPLFTSPNFAQVVGVLLRAGAPAGAAKGNGFTPLLAAAERGHVEVPVLYGLDFLI